MKILFYMIKILSVIVGFFGALSLVRSLSTAFNWYMRTVFGGWVNFGLGLSVIILLVAMLGLGLSIWHTERLISARIDFSVILFVCGVGFYMCYLILTWQMPRWIYDPSRVLLFAPIIAYMLAIFAFSEVVARLCDKNLLSTLYWLAFFKEYRAQPISYGFAILLVSQIVLIFSYQILSIMLIALMVICILTYVAAFMLNLSKVYHAANEDKIRAERFKTELITNVSHDIKTPLTSIINYVDLLKNAKLQGQSAEYLQVLDRKSARLKVLIDDLMEASKAGSGNLKIDLKEIDLSEITGQVAGEFEDSFYDRGLTLVLRQPEEPVLLNTDSRHLHRVLENLFSNAAKYALSGTRVFVEITLNNNGPRIIIQNTSASHVGLSDGEATEQFMRGDKSRQTDGSGLGLYIAKSLIELMDGKLLINISGDLFRVEIFL